MSFLIVLSLYISLIFPIILSLLGLEWVSSDESPLYVYSVVLLNCCVIGYIGIYELRNYKKAVGSFWPYYIPLFIFLIYLVESFIFGYSSKSLASKFHIFFYAFTVSGIFAGTYCYRYNKFDSIAKNFELLMFICAIALIVALPNLSASADTGMVSIGGGNHQAISYSSALAFGTIYCGLKNTIPIPRYKFFLFKFYPLLGIIIMMLLAVVCLIGGGRGGAVLLIINFAVCTLFIAKKNIIDIAISLIFLIVFVYFISTLDLGFIGELLDKGFKRCFAFIDGGNVNLSEGASGRDVVYKKSWNLILQSPIIGHGIFNQYDLCEETFHQPYSHNFIIEFLLQMGMLGLIICLAISGSFIKKENQMLSNNKSFLFLIPMSTYPFVFLLFSATYLNTASLWFVLIFVLGYKYKKSRIILPISTIKHSNI